MNFKFLLKTIFTLYLFLNSLFIFSQNVNLVLQPDSCGKDALIADCIPCGYDDSNFGEFGEFNALAWTNSGSNSNHRSLIQFDFSSIPVGTIIQNAQLTLYYNPASVNASGLHSNLSGANDAYLQKITSVWDEHTVTWNNQPSTTTSNQVYIPASTTGTENYTIDITNMVQDFINNPAQNNGMMLRLATENYFRCLLFASSDNANASLHPKVEVNYTKPDTGCISLNYSSCYGVDALIADCVPCGFSVTNFGGFTEFNALAWTNSGSNSNHRSLIYWDLHDIPSNAIIQEAYLNLFFNNSSINAGGFHSNLSGSNDATLQKITQPWDEFTVTWNNQPATTSLNQTFLPMSTSQTEDYIVDITNLVQNMVDDPLNNFGLMLKLNSETAYRCLLFASSDHPDASKHPKLDICYSIDDNIYESNHSNAQFNVYPNPSNGNVTISLNEIQSNASIKIFNSFAQEILSEKVAQLSHQKSLNIIFPPGIYFICSVNSEKEYSKKIIIY